MSAQYSLPATLNGKLGDRDLEASTLHPRRRLAGAGQGLRPRLPRRLHRRRPATGYEYAKEQLLRELDDTNPDPKLAELEARILDEANQLDIGPMGFGGKTDGRRPARSARRTGCRRRSSSASRTCAGPTVGGERS